eukprot:2057647-Alexandrium_andersonii.AAC.1
MQKEFFVAWVRVDMAWYNAPLESLTAVDLPMSHRPARSTPAGYAVGHFGHVHTNRCFDATCALRAR